MVQIWWHGDRKHQNYEDIQTSEQLSMDMKWWKEIMQTWCEDRKTRKKNHAPKKWNSRNTKETCNRVVVQDRDMELCKHVTLKECSSFYIRLETLAIFLVFVTYIALRRKFRTRSRKSECSIQLYYLFWMDGLICFNLAFAYTHETSRCTKSLSLYICLKTKRNYPWLRLLTKKRLACYKKGLFEIWGWKFRFFEWEEKTHFVIWGWNLESITHSYIQVLVENKAPSPLYLGERDHFQPQIEICGFSFDCVFNQA